MKQADRSFFEAMKIMLQATLKFIENTRLWLVFSVQSLSRLVASVYGFKILGFFHRIAVNENPNRSADDVLPDGLVKLLLLV